MTFESTKQISPVSLIILFTYFIQSSGFQSNAAFQIFLLYFHFPDHLNSEKKIPFAENCNLLFLCLLIHNCQIHWQKSNALKIISMVYYLWCLSPERNCLLVYRTFTEKSGQNPLSHLLLTLSPCAQGTQDSRVSFRET